MHSKPWSDLSAVSLLGRLLTMIVCSIAHQGVLAQSAFDSAALNQAKSQLKLIRVTPSGTDVPTSSRQIVFKFNQPMVAVGQMAVENGTVPIDITPAVNCQWRWLESSSLSCQLKRDDELKKATEYRVSMEPGLRALGGAVMTRRHQYRFTTMRPKITRIELEDWSQAGQPIVRVNVNQPVTKTSLQSALAFMGANSTYVSDIVIPDQWNPLSDEVYLQYPGQVEFAHYPRLRTAENQPAKIKQRAAAKEQARRVWRISVGQNLPIDRKINIALTGGLLGIEGVIPAQKNARLHQFQSLPTFAFKGIDCVLSGSWENELLPPIYPAETTLRKVEPHSPKEPSIESADAFPKVPSCDPMERVNLVFSTPISYQSAANHIRFTPDLAGGDPNYQPWATRNNDYAVRSFFRSRFNYSVNQPFSLWVPEVLKAFEQYALRSESGLLDELGQPIKQRLNMAFLTDHRRPKLSFSHPHSVLEVGVDSELPAYVTNLNRLKVQDYTLTTADQVEGPYSFSQPLPTVQDVAYRVPVGVRELLDGQSGMVVGTLSSTPLTMRYGREQSSRFVSQVTPFQVHVKLGHFNSYAWITDLVTGLPVEGAQVSIELDHIDRVQPQRDMGAVLTAKNGLVELAGLKDIDPLLQHYHAYKSEDKTWFVKVKKGNHVAFLPITNDYKAYAQEWPYLREKDAYMHAWGTTAQGVYKAGDTVQYKFYVRGQSNRHWVAAPDGRYDLSIIDPKGQTVEYLPGIQLNEFGAYDGEFTTPTTAAVGWYDFKLTFNKDQRETTHYPMRVLLSDFTPSPFKAGNDLNGDQFQVGDTVRVDSYAKMHAGGPFADAQARVTASLSPQAFRSDHPSMKDFSFSPRSGTRQVLHQSEGMLDKTGELSTEFVISDADALYGQLQIETAVRDDRGKYIASRSNAQFFGRDRFIGLKQTSWVQEVGKVARVNFVVSDTDGQPVDPQSVELVIEHQVTRAARVKSAGNAYLTQYSQSWVELSRCEQVSTHWTGRCEFTPKQPGYHRITATLKDTKARTVTHQIHTWAVGDGAVIWNDGGTNHIEIIPDQARYSSGDTAKLLIKNPYPGAQALITVERYGVLRSWQQTLIGSTPVIDLPIKSDDYPGVYVSVVVTSARVDKPLGDGEVDLGKPVFKMGYLKLDVRDNSKHIDVTVSSNKKVYKPRETVSISVKAKPQTGKRQPMELAVVAIDEAVFDLNKQGKGYYDPYLGFNKLDELGVVNYNLLMRLIGRQRFEKKGANPGGGGGESSADLRNLLTFVAYWNPSVKLNKRGNAAIKFTLPDNLTGWRVLAIVVDKEARMGLGDLNLKVNRPTELRPVMPNHLTMGDAVNAGFSVMNRTDKKRTLTVQLRAAGSALKTPVAHKEKLTLEPFERQKVWLPITADQTGEIAFFAQAGDARDSDALEHHVPVNVRYTLQSQATYGTTEQASITEQIAFPGDVVTGVGAVSVDVSPSVVGNINGGFRYMRDYPHRCWEQRLSRGVSAAQYQQLKPHLPAELAWPGSAVLTQQTLTDAAQFQAANGGMAYWINDDAYVSPYLSAYTALAFVWLRDQGFAVPEMVERKLQDYLKNYLRRDDHQHNATSQLSIRAVALAALAARGAIDEDELARYRPHLKTMSLFGKAHFLQAQSAFSSNEQAMLELVNLLLSHSVQSGGKISFQEPQGADSPSILHSSVRSNCAVLSALMTASTSSSVIAPLLADLPFKHVRSLTQQRGGRDHWLNTQDSVFCAKAILDFSRVYERITPNMSVSATVDSGGELLELGQTQFNSVRDPSSQLSSESLLVQPNLIGQVGLSKQGQGRYYYSVRTSFAKTEDSAQAVNAGIEARREYSVQRDGAWTPLSHPMQVRKGELVRIDLFVSTSGPRHYVVVDDPVPGGLETVNRDLATSSLIDVGQTQREPHQGSWFYQHKDWRYFGRYGHSFYHQELRHDAVRFYSDYLPAGNYLLSYTAQAIASGGFTVKPLKVEEMYDPDVFGLGIPATLNVQPQPTDGLMLRPVSTTGITAPQSKGRE